MVQKWSWSPFFFFFLPAIKKRLLRRFPHAISLSHKRVTATVHGKVVRGGAVKVNISILYQISVSRKRHPSMEKPAPEILARSYHCKRYLNTRLPGATICIALRCQAPLYCYVIPLLGFDINIHKIEDLFSFFTMIHALLRTMLLSYKQKNK